MLISRKALTAVLTAGPRLLSFPQLQAAEERGVTMEAEVREEVAEEMAQVRERGPRSSCHCKAGAAQSIPVHLL